METNLGNLGADRVNEGCRHMRTGACQRPWLWHNGRARQQFSLGVGAQRNSASRLRLAADHRAGFVQGNRLEARRHQGPAFGQHGARAADARAETIDTRVETTSAQGKTITSNTNAR